MKAAERIAQRISDTLLVLAGIAGALMLLQGTADVLGRYLFNTPIDGTLEIAAAYYMVAIVFLPLGRIQMKHDHISVELLTRHFSKAWSRWIDAGICALALAYAAAFCWVTADEAINATVNGETWPLGDDVLAVWPSRWLLPAGCAAMTGWLLIQTVTATLSVRRGDSPHVNS